MMPCIATNFKVVISHCLNDHCRFSQLVLFTLAYQGYPIILGFEAAFVCPQYKRPVRNMHANTVPIGISQMSASQLERFRR